MIDKCPNCGQPVRPGARFCTSCGFRLPERPVEPSPSPLSRSPFATTSSVAASWWPSTAEPSGEKAESPAAEPEPDATIEAVTPQEATGQAAIEPETVEQVPDGGLASAWPSLSSSPPPATESAEQEVPAITEQAAEAESEMAGDGGAVVTGNTGDTWEKVVREFPAFEPTPHEATVPLEVAVEGPAAGDDPLARVHALLDEIKALLPLVLGPNQLAAAADVESVASALAAAREEAVADRATYDALAEIVADARERPRDVDVMLTLMGRAEAIASLRAAYDRCLAAIDNALAVLARQQSPNSD